MQLIILSKNIYSIKQEKHSNYKIIINQQIPRKQIINDESQSFLKYNVICYFPIKIISIYDLLICL